VLIENKTIAVNTPVSIKLASGEEILARFKEETSSTLTVTQPAAFGPGQDGRMALGPWMVTRSPDDTYRINLQNVVTYGPTEKSIGDVYIKATSKIQPASPGDTNVIDLSRR
jgi:hypothetical protein